MTRYAVRHKTAYEYGGDVAHSHHLLHLKPREFAYQRCLEHSLVLEPEPSTAREDVDSFGNAIARLEYERSHDHLCVTAEMEVEVFSRGFGAFESAEPWEAVRHRLSYRAAPVTDADLDASQFRMRSSHVLLKQSFEAYARECFEPAVRSRPRRKR